MVQQSIWATLLVPQPRSWWTRGIPHCGQKPLALRLRTEPPASSRKAQSVSAGKMGGRGGFGDLMWIQPKSLAPKPGAHLNNKGLGVRNLNQASGSSSMPWTLTRHGPRGPSWSRRPHHCPGRPHGLRVSPPRVRRHCRRETEGGWGRDARPPTERHPGPGPAPAPPRAAAPLPAPRTAWPDAGPACCRGMKLPLIKH